MKGGYVGKILRVDLSSQKLTEEGLPEEHLLRRYIGCWGMGIKYLYDMLPQGYKASDPQNPLVFFTGPLTGLQLPGATNTTLVTKNFDTGFTAGRSHTHGSFGRMMKASGYDGVIVTGKSDRPVYLSINGEKSELRDASAMWGKDTHESEELVKQELHSSKASVAAIGPAGENLCAGGLIANDKNHSFSHSGVGSSMGAKNLKAIACFGKAPVPVANVERLSELRKKWMNNLNRPEHFGMKLGRAKTKKAEYRYMLDLIGFAGKNFQVNQLVEFGLGWSRQKFSPKGCKGCPIACPYDVEITEGPYQGYIATLCGGGEALEGAGSILNIVEPGAIFYLADLFDRLGIECSVAGCTMAMAIESFEKGLITTEETDGLKLQWGDPDGAEKLLRKIVYREGFGEILARGISEAAEWIGGSADEFAAHIKGAGMNLHDWRSAWGVLLGQIVGGGAGWPTGGADCWTPEPDAGYPELTDRFDHRTKPLEVKRTTILKSLNDCSGLCWFVTWGMEGALKLTAECISAVTGWDYSTEELLEAGERFLHLERAFNVKHGLTPADDYDVPPRISQAPPDGRAAGKPIGPYLEGMVNRYYELMGWDGKSGKPWRETLEKMGLDQVAKDLWE
jgi:aldehyde:ferredoxin oxidoreductase